MHTAIIGYCITSRDSPGLPILIFLKSQYSVELKETKMVKMSPIFKRKNKLKKNQKTREEVGCEDGKVKMEKSRGKLLVY